MHFLAPLAFLCSIPSSVEYAYVFGLIATTSIIIFPPNSSLKRPGIFLFLSIRRGLLSFLS